MAPLRASPATFAVLSLLLLSLPHPVTAGKWEQYPTCTRPILDKYAPAACWFGASNATEIHESNDCLCSNKTSIQDSAGDIFKFCGCNDLEEAAGNLTYNCEQSNTPAAYNYDTIIALGSNQTEGCVDIPTATSSSPPSTSTATSAATNTQDHRTGGLDTGGIIGIAIGVPTAIASIIVAILEVMRRLQHKPERAPSHIVMNFVQNVFVPGYAMNAAGRAGDRRTPRLLQI